LGFKVSTKYGEIYLIWLLSDLMNLWAGMYQSVDRSIIH